MLNLKRDIRDAYKAKDYELLQYMDNFRNGDIFEAEEQQNGESVRQSASTHTHGSRAEVLMGSQVAAETPAGPQVEKPAKPSFPSTRGSREPTQFRETAASDGLRFTRGDRADTTHAARNQSSKLFNVAEEEEQ